VTIYAIAGGAGVGKTTAARALAARLGAGWLQLDTVWLTLMEGADPGSARRVALDVRAAVRAAARAGAVDPDALLMRMIAAARLVEEVLPTVLAFETATHPHLVIDGSWLTPAGVGRLAADLPVRAAYLQEADPVAVRRAMDTRRAGAHPRPWHDAMAHLAWTYGQWAADQAQARDLPVVAARPFATQVQRVSQALGLPAD
jgi:predicted kinase